VRAVVRIGEGGNVKKLVLIALAATALVAAPAFADWRVDLGADVLMGLGALSDSDLDTSGSVAQYGILLPMGEVAYQFGVGPVALGVGVRGVTFLIQTLLWPDVFAEIALGPVAVEGHLGGLAFASFGVLGGLFETGEVFIPELSAWFRLGKHFRLGAGAVGMYVPDFDMGTVVFLYYLGGKFIIGG
jgi:hypothetical protein